MKGRQIIIRPPESFQSKWKYQREEGEKKNKKGEGCRDESKDIYFCHFFPLVPKCITREGYSFQQAQNYTAVVVTPPPTCRP